MNAKREIAPADRLVYLPETEDSYPFCGIRHVNKPVDLSAYGYTEEEYLLYGKSNLYSWAEGQRHAHVIMENCSYCTRILVRKPAEPSKFSGCAVVEIFNWARGYDRPIAAWGNSHEHIMKKGDAWIGVSSSSNVLRNLKRFDAERYGDAGFPNPRPEDTWYDVPQADTYHDFHTDPSTEDGLVFDMLSQLGMLLKERSSRNPLYERPADLVLLTGAMPGTLSTYVSAVEPVSCAAGGKNLYDGFLIFMTGAPGNVNQLEEKLKPQDPRCRFSADVPLMRLYTCGDMFGTGHHPDWAVLQRHADEDGPDSFFRSYELPGPNVFLRYVVSSEASAEDLARMGIDNRRAGGRASERDAALSEHNSWEFPTRYIINALMERLKEWCRGTVPPASRLLDVEGDYPDMSFSRDACGNVTGGVRTPFVDVPLYVLRYEAYAQPLPAEVLRSLYGDEEGYRRAFEASTDHCVSEGFLLKEDAETVKEEAGKADFSCFS